MRKTADHDIRAEKVLVTVDELAGMLSCGVASARRIGEDAKARFTVGRRVLYSVDKVKDYVRAMSG